MRVSKRPLVEIDYKHIAWRQDIVGNGATRLSGLAQFACYLVMPLSEDMLRGTYGKQDASMGS